MNVAISGIKLTEGRGNFNLEALLNSAKQVLNESEIVITNQNCWNRGIFVGTSFSNFATREIHHKNYFEKGIRAANPSEFPKGLISYLGGQISARLNLRGQNSTASSFFSSGIDALIQGMFFLSRDKNNKALVVELGEKAEAKRAYATEESVSLVIENRASLEGKNNYGNILAIEAFFEKKGENRGLIKAITRALDRSSLDIGNLDCIVSCSDLSKAKDLVLLEKQALSRFGDLSALKMILQEEERYPSFLFSIAGTLKNTNFSESLGKKDLIVMFIALGQGVNSSCTIIKIPGKEA